MYQPINLTQREAEVVTLLFEAPGLGREGMAARLGISVNTLNRHLKSVYAKADVSGAIGLLGLAWRNGGFLW